MIIPNFLQSGGFMEHHPFVTLGDETEITYSDIKTNEHGEEFVTLYFETPSNEHGFCHASIDYPFGVFYKINHYSSEDLKVLMYHYNKIGKLAFEFAKGEEECLNL